MILSVIKQAALEAVLQAMPVEVRFGTVLSTEPVGIRLDKKLVLEECHLILTAGALEGLNIGDVVIMLRVQGGQSYVVLDKAGA